jgi:thiol-disulfide isomerase/thioredoxin
MALFNQCVFEFDTFKEYNDFLLSNTDKLTIVDFYADWCAPCKKIAPFLEEIATEYNTIFIKINVDNDDFMDYLKNNKVKGLPHFYLYNSEMNELSQDNHKIIKTIELLKEFIKELTDNESFDNQEEF